VSVRLYGPTRGNASFHRITLGMREALRRADVLSGYYPTDHEVFEESPPGALAHTAVMTGMANHVGMMTTRGVHAERLLLIAPNSSWLPQPMVDAVQAACTGVIAPSRWGAEVLARHFRLPVTVWQHGVDDAFKPREPGPLSTLQDFAYDRFRVGHLASSTRQRKGTVELLEAWVQFVRRRQQHRQFTLQVILSDTNTGEFHERIEDLAKGDAGLIRSVHISQYQGLTLQRAAAWYQSLHVVCQPSRGEGFGMVPLEARACGVPVIATACTGHSEGHVEGPGVIIVPHGPEKPIDDGPGAVAPSVAVEDIVQALERAFDNWMSLSKEAEAAAPSVRQAWSWDAVTARWLEQRGGRR